MNLRLIVTGGRCFGQKPGETDLLNATLDRIHRERVIACIIHGGACGADELSRRWAARSGVAAEAYIADWYWHGKAAGPKRNQKMVDEARADGVIAFVGGAGTADCVRRAEGAGLKVWRVGW